MTSRSYFPNPESASPESTDSTTPEGEPAASSGGRDARHGTLTLCLLWCPEEPWRTGEVALLPGRGTSGVVLGRGHARPDDPGPRVVLGRATPSGVEAGLAIGISQISRVQMVIRIEASNRELALENVGLAPLLVNGVRVDRTLVRPGDTVQLGRQLLLLCVRRSAEPAGALESYPPHVFGKPDAFGIVGESLSIWRLRRQIAFLGTRREHVLVKGPSGSGKELVAHAIHALSKARDRSMVSRNAATIPAGLVDAELYGNVRNYPNSGMPDRPGLIGEANGGTLYLDEFGELPEASQVHLLRVLDGGDYQRLGEATARRSTFRLIAATNRSEQVIKEDLLARIPLRIEVPDLNERREDIPLLVLHLLRRFAGADATLAARFFPDLERLPRISFGFLQMLVQHPYRTNVRELEALLLSAIQTSEGHEIQSFSAPEGEPATVESDGGDGGHASTPVGTASENPSPAQIRAALDRNNGAIEATWRDLGLKNRYVLRRLLAKHRIETLRRH